MTHKFCMESFSEIFKSLNQIVNKEFFHLFKKISSKTCSERGFVGIFMSFKVFKVFLLLLLSKLLSLQAKKPCKTAGEEIKLLLQHLPSSNSYEKKYGATFLEAL